MFLTDVTCSLRRAVCTARLRRKATFACRMRKIVLLPDSVILQKPKRRKVES